jgi:hypothetical protein
MNSFILHSKSTSIIILFVRYTRESHAQGGIRAESDPGSMLDHESLSVGCVNYAEAIHAGSGDRQLKRIDPRATTPFPGSS